MSNDNRVVIFETRANALENVVISHETYMGTPLVSIRRFRGNSYTGKGISLQPDLLEQLMPHLSEAVRSLRQQLATEPPAFKPDKGIRKISKNSIACE